MHIHTSIQEGSVQDTAGAQDKVSVALAQQR